MYKLKIPMPWVEDYLIWRTSTPYKDYKTCPHNTTFLGRPLNLHFFPVLKLLVKKNIPQFLFTTSLLLHLEDFSLPFSLISCCADSPHYHAVHIISLLTDCGKISQEFCPKNQPILVTQQVRWYDKYKGTIHVKYM